MRTNCSHSGRPSTNFSSTRTYHKRARTQRDPRGLPKYTIFPPTQKTFLTIPLERLNVRILSKLISLTRAR